MEGYNGTIFAYGQSVFLTQGSGKTFTMLGPEDVTSALVKDVSAIPPLVQANFGIIPRAIINIFEYITEGVRESTEFSIKCSYIEVYNEQVNCLLSSPPALNLRIREFPRMGMCVIGMAETFVRTPEEIFDCLALGTLNRITGATLQNSRSSRSHTLFIITMEQKFFDGSVKTAKLNLVDLAGSEKISKTGAQGARLKEAQNINLSLTTLGRCINALASTKDKHVPFRESKLTMILKESLGGNAKTTLLCTASPKKVHYDESISTLQFAERAKKIQVKAKVNKTESIDELNAIISKLKEEVNSLRKQLVEASSHASPEASCHLDDQDIYIQYAELRAKYEHYQEATQMEIEQLKQKFDLSDADTSAAQEDELYETAPFQHSPEADEVYEEVRRRMEQEITYTKLQNEELQRQVVSLKAETETLSETLAGVKKDAEALEVRQYEWEDKLNAEESRWKTERMKVEELESRLESNEKEHVAVEQERAELVAQMIDKHEETTKLQAALSASQRRAAELEGELVNVSQLCQSQAAELLAAKNSIEKLQENMNALSAANSEEISKCQRNEEILRLSLGQMVEENRVLARKLEISETRSSSRSQQELNRSFEYERRHAVSKETISKLLQEMTALQQAFEQTNSKHNKELAFLKHARAVQVEELERSIGQLQQKLASSTAANKQLEEATKAAEIEHDCLGYKNKLLKEELISLQTKFTETQRSLKAAEEMAEKLKERGENVDATRKASLEVKRQEFERQKILRDLVQNLSTKNAKLTSENEFMKKALEMKERIIAKMKGSDEPIEFDLDDAMRQHKRQSSRRMSSKLSTFVPRLNQESLRLTQETLRIRASEGRFTRNSISILPSVDLAFVLQNVSALYSTKEEETGGSAV